MISGILHKDRNELLTKEVLLQFVPKTTASFVNQNLAMGISSAGVPLLDQTTGISFSADNKIVVAAACNIFDFPQDQSIKKDNTADIILSMYQKFGELSFKNINGQFSAAIWDSTKNRFILVRDHLGFEPLFYFWDGKDLIFSSSLRSLINYKDIGNHLNFRAIRNYLLFNYNPGLDTFINNVKKVRPGHILIFENGGLSLKQYWSLSYQHQDGRPLEDYSEELVQLTKNAVRIRSQETSSDPGVFLSGGMDSSSVVGLLSGQIDRPIHTFSFRCLGKSTDESYYARVMANHYKTVHHEIPYNADELYNLESMTEWMEEPLCDIGIELGSFILGRAAHKEVSYILTGDGGDELYAGHPVYLADNMASLFDKIPSPLRKAAISTASILPDSDKKKSLLVKARRFAYNYKLPAELLSNRWRIYYTGGELADLCTPDVLEQFGELNSYKDITDLYSGADGPDLLSNSLFADFQTLSHFHIDRMRLTRASGVIARFPLYDYKLVEFSASIPNKFKIKSSSEVKFIEKKALEGILPDEIVFRKKKMGHNVPMKNWMRESPIFRDLINQVLSTDTIKKRSFFKQNFIQKMMEQHLQKKKDYSHRLYSLLVLELWMQKNLDN